MKYLLSSFSILAFIIFLTAACNKNDSSTDPTQNDNDTTIKDTTSKDTTSKDTLPELDSIIGYNYYGAEIATKETFLYGRFEARMKMVYSPGCISSMFLYYNNSYIGNGEIWNEIDIEVLGKDSLHFQSNIISGTAEKKVTSEKIHTMQNAVQNNYHTYVIEWTPEYVSWIIDNNEIRRDSIGKTKAQVEYLTKTQSLRFNVWASSVTSWVGKFTGNELPTQQYIDYVKVSTYDTIAKTFTESWTDDFTTFNSSRWDRGNWQMELVMLKKDNVTVEDGNLLLQLTKEPIYSE